MRSHEYSFADGRWRKMSPDRWSFMKTPSRVIAFIDWDSARRLLPHDHRRGRSSLNQRACPLVLEALSAALTEWKPGPYRVRLRLYHGWTQGKTSTKDRRELETLNLRDCAPGVIRSVSFEPELYFGDRLLCGGGRCMLQDTLRASFSDQAKLAQKMVDTALVSDLLHAAKVKAADVFVVFGDDDDLLPGAITAEAWGSQLFVLRQRGEHNKHLRTEGLIRQVGPT